MIKSAKEHKYAQGQNGLTRAKRIQNIFLNLEKRHQSSNIIKELKTQEGNVSNDYEIIGEMCKFY